jgi:hypothetical protein
MKVLGTGYIFSIFKEQKVNLCKAVTYQQLLYSSPPQRDPGKKINRYHPYSKTKKRNKE